MSTVTSMERTAPVSAPPAAAPQSAPWTDAWRERLEAALRAVVGPVAGFALFVLVWQVVAMRIPEIPTPGVTWRAAVELFADPFYDNGPNDKGIGWNLLASLQRVGIGFGLAALVGIPAGFAIGRYAPVRAMFSPIVSLLRPVSPLAWLPLGLLLFKAANPAAIWAIFICSIWPMIINTAVGVSRVPQDYLNVARVLNLSEWKVTTKVLLPAVLPYMLTGGTGIGFWLWDEWNNLKVEHIVIAIFVIGIVGLILETLLVALARRFTYTEE